MKKLELLNHPVFQKALPTSHLFVVKISDDNHPIIGIGELNRDYSNRRELVFASGVPLIIKEQMEKALRLKCKGVKNWNPDINILFSDGMLDPGTCDVVQTKERNLILRPYWTENDGTKVYFDNYQM